MVLSLESRSVVKSNKLIEACYRLSLNEQRIILAVIAQIDKNEQPTDAKVYKISLNEIIKLSGLKGRSSYEQLHLAAFNLKKRDVKIATDCGKRTILTAWVQAVHYNNEYGSEIEIRLSHEMLPYVTDLSREFTIYKYKHISRLTSVYAIRIYEMLVQWGSVGVRYADIDWLRECLMLESKYPLFKDFKKNVVVPAVNQINEHSDLFVSFELQKRGRKVTHINFKFKPKSKVISMESKKTKAETKPSQNVTIKNAGDGEHLGKYHPFSKLEIMQGQLRFPDLTEMQVKDKLLAEINSDSRK